jgi:hypothetical protein
MHKTSAIKLVIYLVIYNLINLFTIKIENIVLTELKPKRVLPLKKTVKPCSLMDKALPFECKDMCSTHVRTTTPNTIKKDSREYTNI